LWFAVLCAFPPTKYRGVLSLIGVVNELIAPKFPYSKSVHLVIAWQRGMGTFQFDWRIVNQDGDIIVEIEPIPITMYPEGNQHTAPFTLTVRKLGLYLFEGFLDGDDAFKTTLRVVPK
jgi:hypothetical protein